MKPFLLLRSKCILAFPTAIGITFLVLINGAGVYGAVIPLKEDLRLVDVFKAGLHPRYVPGMKNMRLEVFGVMVRFESNGYVSPEMTFDDLGVFVYQEGRVAQILANTRTPMSIDEARQLGRRWGAPEIEMEAFLEWVAANPVAYRGSRWGWPLLNNPKMGAGFRRSFNAEKPLLFQVTIGWDIPRIEAKTYDKPIQPPDGFEHLSLEPLPFEPKVASQEAKTLASIDPIEASPTPPAQSEPNRVSQGSSRKWFWLSLIFLLLFFAVVFYKRFKFSKPT